MEDVFTLNGRAKELVIGDKVFHSADDFELTKKDLKRAHDDLGETEEKKIKCLKELKEMLLKDEKVKYCMDNPYLLRFLRVRKYNVERAYENVKLLYAAKKKIPDFFAIPSDLKSIQSLNFTTYLPYTDEEGRIIYWLNFDRWNPEVYTYEEMMQCVMAQCDIVTLNPKCQINGVIGVWDASGICRKHITEILQYNRLRAMVTAAFQNGYPYRLHKLIVLNAGTLIKMLYNISRPFLSRKVSERIILIGSDLAEVHQHVNPVLLPKALGGALEEEECSVTQNMIDNLPYIRYERSFT